MVLNVSDGHEIRALKQHTVGYLTNVIGVVQALIGIVLDIFNERQYSYIYNDENVAVKVKSYEKC